LPRPGLICSAGSPKRWRAPKRLGGKSKTLGINGIIVPPKQAGSLIEAIATPKAVASQTLLPVATGCSPARNADLGAAHLQTVVSVGISATAPAADRSSTANKAVGGVYVGDPNQRKYPASLGAAIAAARAAAAAITATINTTVTTTATTTTTTTTTTASTITTTATATTTTTFTDTVTTTDSVLSAVDATGALACVVDVAGSIDDDNHEHNTKSDNDEIIQIDDEVEIVKLSENGFYDYNSTDDDTKNDDGSKKNTEYFNNTDNSVYENNNDHKENTYNGNDDDDENTDSSDGKADTPLSTYTSASTASQNARLTLDTRANCISGLSPTPTPDVSAPTTPRSAPVLVFTESNTPTATTTRFSYHAIGRATSDQGPATRRGMKKKVVTLPLPPKPSVPSKAPAELASLQEIQAPALPKSSAPVLGALGSRMLGSEGVEPTVIQPYENAFSSYMDRYKVHTFTPTILLNSSSPPPSNLNLQLYCCRPTYLCLQEMMGFNTAPDENDPPSSHTSQRYQIFTAQSNANLNSLSIAHSL
jgi:hypothetical protein